MRTTHDDATVRLYHLDGGPEGFHPVDEAHDPVRFLADQPR